MASSVAALYANAPTDERLSTAPYEQGAAPIEIVEGALLDSDTFFGEETVTDARAGRLLLELASVGQALAGLHARGRVHGDLRPAALGRSEEGVTLLVSSRLVDAAKLLSARLKDGASPSAVAYAASEVSSGGPATMSSDVYSLAALTYRALSGRLPLGHLVIGKAARSDVPLMRALVSALDADPAARPSMSALAEVLAGAGQRLTAAAGEQASQGSGDAAEEAPRPRFGVDAEPGFTPRPFGSPRYEPSEARQREASGLLTAVLVVGGFFVVIGALWLGLVTWEALPFAGRFVLLCGLTVGLGVSGVVLERRGWTRSGRLLLVAFTQVLWGDFAYLIDVAELKEEPPWVAASVVVFLVTFGVAAKKRSALLASLAALDALVLFVVLGSWLSTGSQVGPALYAFAVSAMLLGVAYGGHLLAGPRLAVPHALLAALVLPASAALALGAPQAPWFAALWPYAPLGLGVVLGWRLAKPYGQLFLLPALGFAALPTLEALLRRDQLGFLIFAALVGVAALLSAFVAFDEDDKKWQPALVLLGLVHAASAPALLALETSAGKRFLDASFPHLGLALGIAIGLIVVAVRLSAQGAPRATYRLVEVTGVSLYFFVTTALTLSRTEDVVYPTLALAGGALLLLTAVVLERLVLALLSGAALVVNVWIQYFARLYDDVPLSALLIGFGVGLLVLGVYSERRLRRWAPKLREWR